MLLLSTGNGLTDGLLLRKVTRRDRHFSGRLQVDRSALGCQIVQVRCVKTAGTTIVSYHDFCYLGLADSGRTERVLATSHISPVIVQTFCILQATVEYLSNIWNTASTQRTLTSKPVRL